MSNVDSAEIQKFSELAHHWWDPNSEFKPLHEINPLRLAWIVDHCGGLAKKTAVDVGCGGGILSESMAAQGAAVTGVDMAEKALKVARLHLYESGLQIDYQQIPVEELAALHPASFDVVTCMEMLEHVPNPASVVQACAQLAKPGGWVFFSTLNRNPKSYLFAVIGAEYLLKLLPKGTHDYAKFIKPAELARMVREAELEMHDLTGLTYNPLTKVYKLEADVDVNYMIACQKPV
ncbi:MAG TPA: bifunctional 2-polyprenyl-6-hydroxyphenol methylase/3-demethylubiquinol 3-O-methyltransferase UbiG [Thiobacillaceae bacterium]|nr:bifunctional 2-polyprenyl-6-hydroxyphenol methylase/3-demethylubiquinol 3-O-methyltransferase UbiG [Thiobacillaceae bacterium]